MFLEKHIRLNILTLDVFVPIVSSTLNTICLPNTSFEITRDLNAVLEVLFNTSVNGILQHFIFFGSTLILTGDRLDVVLTLLEAKIQTMTVDECLGVFSAIKALITSGSKVDISLLKWLIKFQDKILKTAKNLVKKIANQMKEGKETDWNENNRDMSKMYTEICF